MRLLNSLTLRIPVKTVSSNYNLDPPQFLLFIRKSELQEFFEKKKLPDNVNTFYAKYDSDAHVYNFTGLRTFINNIIEKKRTGTEITDADEEIVLVPVSSGGSYYYYSYNEKEVVTDVVPYISAPSLALVDVDNIELRLTYSKQDMK